MIEGLGTELVERVAVTGTTWVVVEVVRTVWRVVERNVLSGVAAAIVVVMEALPVTTYAQAAEIREGDQDDTEAGVCIARFLALRVRMVVATVVC